MRSVAADTRRQRVDESDGQRSLSTAAGACSSIYAFPAGIAASQVSNVGEWGTQGSRARAGRDGPRNTNIEVREPHLAVTAYEMEGTHTA